MKAIKHALTERWYAWEDARRVAQADDTVDMAQDPDVGSSIEVRVSVQLLTCLRMNLKKKKKRPISPLQDLSQ